MVYVSLKCSICHRVKDVAQDNVRAMTTGCTITKGCRGELYSIGTHALKKPTPSIPGLTDWYPRGQTPLTTVAPPTEELVSLSCSSSGLLTLAIFMTQAQAVANPKLLLNMMQLLTSNVKAISYVYNITTPLTSLAGRDSTGKNLRFDENAIADNLIQVIVNGVERKQGGGVSDYTLTSSMVMFNTALNINDIAEVLVFAAAPTQQIQLNFTLNSTVIPGLISGAWGNIRWVDEYDISTGELKSVSQGGKLWWLYSCNALDVLSIESQLTLLNIVNAQTTASLIPGVIGDFTKARFLLASEPYANADRLLNFYIDPTEMVTSYILQSQLNPAAELFASTSVLEDINPPFQLISNTNLVNSSYIAADTIPTNDALSSDQGLTILTATRIIGPT